MTEVDGYAALAWLVGTCAPAWLDAAGLPDDAALLRAMPPLLDMDAVRAAVEPLRTVQGRAFQHSGVARWHDVDARFRPFGAYAAGLAASAIVGHDHSHPHAGLLNGAGQYAWTAATYAAHAVPDVVVAEVAAKLRASLPAGLEIDRG